MLKQECVRNVEKILWVELDSKIEEAEIGAESGMVTDERKDWRQSGSRLKLK